MCACLLQRGKRRKALAVGCLAAVQCRERAALAGFFRAIDMSPACFGCIKWRHGARLHGPAAELRCRPCLSNPRLARTLTFALHARAPVTLPGLRSGSEQPTPLPARPGSLSQLLGAHRRSGAPIHRRHGSRSSLQPAAAGGGGTRPARAAPRCSRAGRLCAAGLVRQQPAALPVGTAARPGTARPG